MLYSDFMSKLPLKKLHYYFKNQVKSHYPHVFKHHSFKDPIKALSHCVHWKPTHTQSNSELLQRINVSNTHLCSDTNHVFLYVGDTVGSDQHEVQILDDEHIYHIMCNKFELIPYVLHGKSTRHHMPMLTKSIVAHAYMDCFISLAHGAKISSLFFTSCDNWEHKTIDEVVPVKTFAKMARNAMTDYQLMVFVDDVYSTLIVIASLQKDTNKLFIIARTLDSAFDNDFSDSDPERTRPATVFEVITPNDALEPGFFMFQKDRSLMFIYKSQAGDKPIVVKEFSIVKLEQVASESSQQSITTEPIQTHGCVRALSAMHFNKKMCQFVCGFLFVVDPKTGFIYRGEFQDAGVYWTEHRNLIHPRFDPTESNIFAVSNINGSLIVMEETKRNRVRELKTIVTTHYLTAVPSDVDITYYGHFLSSDSCESIATSFREVLVPKFAAYTEATKAESTTDPASDDSDENEEEWIDGLHFKVDVVVKRFIDDDSLTTTTITVWTSYCNDDFAVLFTAAAKSDIEKVLGFNLPLHITDNNIFAFDDTSNYLEIMVFPIADGTKKCTVGFEGVPGVVFHCDVV